MIRTLLTTLAVTSLATSLPAQSPTTAPAAPAATKAGRDTSAFRHERFVDADGRGLNYRILLPEHFDASRKYPLILFLHGAGERGEDNEKQLTHPAGLFLDPANRREHPAIVIAPQCPTEKYWVDLSIRRNLYAHQPNDFREVNAPPMRELLLVKGLVDQVIADGSVDRDRVYLTGLSMGALGGYEMLARWPDTFAAAALICGGGNIEATKRYAPHVALWLFHGDEDPIVPVQYSRDLHAALKAHGADVRYSEFPGVKHDAWGPAYAQPELLTWMFSKSRRVPAQPTAAPQR